MLDATRTLHRALVDTDLTLYQAARPGEAGFRYLKMFGLGGLDLDVLNSRDSGVTLAIKESEDGYSAQIVDYKAAEAVASFKFQAPPLFTRERYPLSKKQLERNLRNDGVEFADLTPMSGKPIIVGTYLETAPDLYIAADLMGSVFIGARVACPTNTKAQRDLLRTADGWFCSVRVLTFYPKRWTAAP